MSTFGISTWGLPADTVSFTVPPLISGAWGIGSCFSTLPAGSLSLGSVVTVKLNPALPSAATASSCVLPITSGTGNVSGAGL